jgi:hypothetical protein
MKFALLALVIYLSYEAVTDVSTNPKIVYDCDCVTTYEKVYEGSFQNKNQYMQNPYVNCSDSVTRFATASVTINDTIKMHFEDFNSSAFEIPLMDYHFKVGDPVRIVVKHYGCGIPKMLNPEVYKLK